MAFPTDITAPAPLIRTMLNALGDARSLKNIAGAIVTDIDAGTGVEARTLIEMFEDYVSIRTRLIAARDTPGIGQVFKDHFNDQSLDIAAEFNAMMSELTGLLVWMQANFASSADGFVKESKFETDGSRMRFTYTAVQLGPLKTRLDALSATIA